MILTAEQQERFESALISANQIDLITRAERERLMWAYDAANWDTAHVILTAEMKTRLETLCPFLAGDGKQEVSAPLQQEPAKDATAAMEYGLQRPQQSEHTGEPQ